MKNITIKIKKIIKNDAVFRFTLFFSIFSIFDICTTLYSHSYLYKAIPFLYKTLFYLFGFVWTYLFFKFCLVLNKYFFLIMSFISTFFSFIWFFVYFYYKTILSPTLLYTLFYPIKEDMQGFNLFNSTFFILLSFIVCLWFLSIYPLFKKKKNFVFKQFYIFSFLLIPLIFFNFVILFIKPAPIFNYISIFTDYFILREKMEIKNEFNFVDYSAQVQNTTKQPLLTVMYLGESQRGDHLQINGYRRETTPLLMRDNVLNFGIIKSANTNTLSSVPYILTSVNYQENYLKAIKEKSISHIFTKNNFNSYYIGTFHNPFTDTWSKGEKKFLLSYYFGSNDGNAYHIEAEPEDSNFTKDISELFDIYLKKGYDTQKNNYLLLRNEGSHPPYDSGYPDGARKFIPAQKYWPKANNKENRLEMINAYDNTIVYFDQELDHIITKIKEKHIPALIIYTSDHGESLGENGYYIHTNSSIEVRMSELLVWVSDEYKKIYPEKYKELVNNAKNYKNQLSHNVIWHSLLDGSGFQNKDTNGPIKKEYSIFSQQLKPELNPDWYKVNYTRN